jgi:hypothetical protein
MKLLIKIQLVSPAVVCVEENVWQTAREVWNPRGPGFV